MSNSQGLILNTQDRLSELAVKESILGLMKNKDLNSKGVIHSSDFRSVIDDYGLEMGNKLIQNILVNCNIDTKGNINYSSLEKALSDERNILMSTKSQKFIPTSQTAVEKPIRADLSHKHKIQSEKNVKNLQANRTAIQEMYQLFVVGKINENEFSEFIEVIKFKYFINVS
jgi:Ca2+-binding EF-hand superfamily protein